MSHYRHGIVVCAVLATVSVMYLTIVAQQKANQPQPSFLKDMRFRAIGDGGINGRNSTAASASQPVDPSAPIVPSTLNSGGHSGEEWVKEYKHPRENSSWSLLRKLGNFLSPILWKTAGAQADDGLSSFSSAFIHRESPNRKVQNVSKKLIYFYDVPQWFGDGFEGCEVGACASTKEKTQGEKADAVLVHLPWIRGDPPTFVRPQKQVWVAFGLESPHHYNGVYKNPAWRGAFNWTMTYRVDSDVFYPYGFLVYRKPPPHRNYTSIALRKTKNAAWFVSNCHVPSKRHEYVSILSQSLDVDTYGACGPLKCGRNEEQECLKLLNTTYRFYLAFENSLCQDYVTEKFFKTFRDIQVIPVVRGGANYTNYFPPGTFVDAGDFETPEDLAQHLRHLAADTDTYADMLRRKDHFVSIDGAPTTRCSLCKMLHSDLRPKHYHDFPVWNEKGMCRIPKTV